MWSQPELQAAEQHSADDRDADRGAEALRSTEDAGRGACLLAGHRGEDEVLVRRNGHPGPEASYEQRADEVPATHGWAGQVYDERGQGEADEKHQAAENENEPSQP